MKHIRLFEELSRDQPDKKALDYLVFMLKLGYIKADEIELGQGELRGYDIFLIWENNKVGFVFDEALDRDTESYSREIAGTQYRLVVSHEIKYDRIVSSKLISLDQTPS